ncbi:MAG: class I tRNA ligase family protein [Adlercreutzia equolifaciens]
MSDLNSRERVEWPARAVVTAGMPYGNKPLHFGHIGGVFVPADAFARFLRDRIGAENVRFVSGTDCFGSPINEGYRKLKEAGEFEGSIADYVLANHERQKATAEAFQVSLDIYEGSGIGHAGDVHQMISDQFIERLHESGHLKLDSTLQFYDAEAGTFLNGRQVQGHCPVQGCKSGTPMPTSAIWGISTRRWASSLRCPRSRVPSPRCDRGELVFRPARVRGLPEGLRARA